MGALDDGEGPDREGSKAFHFDGNGEECEVFSRERGEMGHMFDNNDFLP